MKLCSIKEGFG